MTRSFSLVRLRMRKGSDRNSNISSEWISPGIMDIPADFASAEPQMDICWMEVPMIKNLTIALTVAGAIRRDRVHARNCGADSDDDSSRRASRTRPYH